MLSVRTLAGLAVLTLILTGYAVASDPTGVPDNAAVRLTTDRETFFLGENVLIHFELINTGGAAFEADFGGDYRGAMRSLRFEVTGFDEDGKPLSDPYPSKNHFGGFVGPTEVTPESPFAKSLPLTRYLRIEKPGKYTIKVTHDFGWEPQAGQKLPTGTIDITFEQPTEKTAADLVEKWIATEEYSGSSTGEKSENYPDFSQIRNPVFLPALTKHARLGNRDAIVGLGSIAHRDATAELIRLSDANPATDEQKVAQQSALNQLSMRVPDPMLLGELGTRNPFHQNYLAPRRWLVENSWDDEFVDEVRDLAKKLLRSDEASDVASGAFLITCVGKDSDGGAVVTALDREVAKTRSLEVESDIYPRPRGACQELQRAATILMSRGFKPPENPTTDGEAIFFCIALGQEMEQEELGKAKPDPLDRRPESEWRPKGWKKTLDQLLHDPTPYIVENALVNAPKPFPIELRHHLGRVIDAEDVNAAIAACDIVEDEKLVEFTDSILAKLRVAEERWLFRHADSAAIELGAEEKRLRILVSRLDEKDMLFPCLESIKSMFSNAGGGGLDLNIHQVAAARRIKPLWEAFVDRHAAEIRAGKKFTLPHPEISKDMFPESYSITLSDGKSWPDR